VAAIDPGDIETWPPDVREHIAHLARRCRANPENSAATHSYELELEDVDAAFVAAVGFRHRLGDRRVALYHATRLLPHEVTGIRQDGLLTLSEGRRDARLDAVIARYGDRIGTERLEGLRRSGPLTWGTSHRNARLGVLYAVTPLKDAFAGAGGGMTVFLENWGGEAFYWAGHTDETIAQTIAALTQASQATIVEVAVPASWLNAYRNLWQVFVGQLEGCVSPWHEFRITENIPPQQVLELRHETSARWPRAVGPLRSP